MKTSLEKFKKFEIRNSVAATGGECYDAMHMQNHYNCWVAYENYHKSEEQFARCIRWADAKSDCSNADDNHN